LLLAALFIIPNKGLAQTKAQKIDALMAKFHEYGQFNGSGLVAENGKVIFKLNVEAFPQSSDVYDSLGEAYMINGDKELAVKNYEKSLYFTSEDGEIFVVKAGPQYKLISTNSRGEVCMATPAISEGMIFVRDAEVRLWDWGITWPLRAAYGRKPVGPTGD
jgi:hypothetical protein